MHNFMALRLKPIDIDDLVKGQAHTILYAKPQSKIDRPIGWYTTEIVFSKELGKWVANDRSQFHCSYYYCRLGTAHSIPLPDEDWDVLQLFSPHDI